MQKISVICSAFKSNNKIKILIRSFLKQKYKNKELIIVDGSSNNLLKTKIRIFNNYRNITYFNLKNSTIYEAINFGILNCKGNIINIMGDDDFYANQYLFSEINRYNFKKKILVFGDTIYSKDKKSHRYYKSNYALKLIDIGYIPSHTSMFISKKICERLNLYSPKYLIASDLDFFLKLKNYKVKFIYSNKIHNFMNLGGKSNKSIANIIKSNVESYKILKKNKGNLILMKLTIKLFIKMFLLIAYRFKKINEKAK